MSDDLRTLVQRCWDSQRAGILEKANLDLADAPETALSFFLWARRQDAATQAKLHAGGWVDAEVHTRCDCRACAPLGWCQ